MKQTLEERSRDYIQENFEGWEDQEIIYMCADAYEQGCKDQLNIDIQALCDYMEKFNEGMPMKVDIDSWRDLVTSILKA